jgi:serine/threonine protein kinase
LAFTERIIKENDLEIFPERWHRIREIGEGGQGKVYLVLDRDEWVYFRNSMSVFWGNLSKNDPENERDLPKYLYEMRNMFWEMADKENPPREYALKVLYQAKQNWDEKQAQERIRREIKAMQDISHPNLLKVIDANLENYWYVSKYYKNGTLGAHLHRYAGNLPKILEVFIPLVEGIVELHYGGKVHRDIKPDNIFIDDNENLVLGDFGLVYFTDLKMSRLSNTLENAGSRDWMPLWAQGMRISEIKPSFDVYCLGKVLWAMVSGKNFLRAWYFDQDEFNVERIYPLKTSINLINPLLKRCVVQHESECTISTEQFLNELKQLATAVDVGADNLKYKFPRKCKVCGIGRYFPVTDEKYSTVSDYGFNPNGGKQYKIFICRHCGNVQLFLANPTKDDYPAWQ